MFCNKGVSYKTILGVISGRFSTWSFDDGLYKTILHLKVCELILNNAKTTEDKNPFYNWNGRDLSPLHLAAGCGQLEVCKLILQHVQNKNPEASNGWTPLHSAAQMGPVSKHLLIL